MEEMKLLQLKEAIEITLNYFKEIYDRELHTYRDINIEEIELSDDEDYWYITVGYTVPSTMVKLFQSSEGMRKYKIFKVDSNTGAVKSMKIRIPYKDE